jgi:hypothetical protein
MSISAVLFSGYVWWMAGRELLKVPASQLAKLFSSSCNTASMPVFTSHSYCFML